MADFDMIARIEATKRGSALDDRAVAGFVQSYMAGRVSEAQAAAWLMAVCLKGLDDGAASALTAAMAACGETLDLSDLAHTADKHSTGGVGDKVTLVACPLAVAAGCTVAKMSGRGLGHTGGTIDKLEAIPGFRTDLSAKEFRQQAARVGLVVASQSHELSPADRRLYALRHETATVDSLPLIAASVMSKKLAAGASSIVLDVKCGRGAFMGSADEAARLASLMCHIGASQGRAMGAAVTPMNQPLGFAVGHVLEVREAVETLRGDGPSDLEALSLELSAKMVHLSGAAESWEAARGAVGEALTSGRALTKLAEMVRSQGGDARVLDDPSRLPRAPLVDVLRSPTDGRISAVDALGIAQAVACLGGSRKGREAIDHRVGVRLLRKCGDPVEPGEPILEIHAPSTELLEHAKTIAGRAMRVGDAAGPPKAEFEIRWVS
jgi:pyrimidine-nucleoside phosphorylase